MSIDLLIIDPQNDFVEPGHALTIPGAAQDMERLSKLIQNHSDDIDNIHVTMDTHRLMHIASPAFWLDMNGHGPKPFSTITAWDVAAKKWNARNSIYASKAYSYLQDLEVLGKTHTIWPPHCLIGTYGHAVYAGLTTALHNWELNTGNLVSYINKGEALLAEHFSAIRAEVIDKDDDRTMVNHTLLHELYGKDLWVAGEASTHCVLETLEHLIIWSKSSETKLTLLEDCTSPVPGFEKNYKEFKERNNSIRYTTTEKCGRL